MTDPATPEVLTVLYDGGCPLCRREINHLQGLAAKQQDSGLCFVDVSAPQGQWAADEQARLPGWRWLARLARWPGVLPALEWAYRGFLHVRPRLQALARRMERSR